MNNDKIKNFRIQIEKMEEECQEYKRDMMEKEVYNIGERRCIAEIECWKDKV